LKIYWDLWYCLAEFFSERQFFYTEFIEKIKTQGSCPVTFFPPRKSCNLWDKVEKNIVEPDRSRMTIWCILIECWIPKAKKTYSEYVIRIAFSLQQWLHRRASILRHTYITCHTFTLRISPVFVPKSSRLSPRGPCKKHERLTSCTFTSPRPPVSAADATF